MERETMNLTNIKTPEVILRLEIHHWVRDIGMLFYTLLTQTLIK